MNAEKAGAYNCKDTEDWGSTSAGLWSLKWGRGDAVIEGLSGH